MPQVSIIIPCYNHGAYIDEALNSIAQIPNNDLYEIIIVNDGSTDAFTNEKLQALSKEGYHVIFQKNSGLATARNNGIIASKGKYILPLDADNKLRPQYIDKGCAILESNPNIAIVFGNAEKFGSENGILKQGPYNLQKLMIANHIDACAIYRREIWEVTGGYDAKMPAQGIEDWCMWLHSSFLGYKFHYLDETVFDYRVLEGSMIKTLRKNKIKSNANITYMMSKFPEYFGPNYIDADILHKFEQSPIGFIGKIILKKYFPSTFENNVKKGSLRKYI